MKTRLGRPSIRCFSLLLLISLAIPAARAGNVTGVVHNGTTNKPAAGVDVLLIALQGGMQTVADTKTDATGHYHFDNPGIGAGPMLIRAVYRGVNFHQPLTPGTATVDVNIFEPTENPLALQVTGRLIVFQPNGEKLLVGEEYSIQNKVNPPAAYFKEGGDFEFILPEGAVIAQVSSTGPSGMPITQGTIDKGKNHYAIAYAFQPGQNSVRLSYEVPYKDNRAAFAIATLYDSQRVLLVAPPTVQLTSAGFDPAGSEQGYSVYARDSVLTGTAINVSLSGTAPTSAQGSSGASQSDGRGAGPTVETAPARLGNEKWILLGGLAAIFAVGLALLFKRPVQAVTAAPAQVSSNGPRSKASGAPVAASPPVQATLSEKVSHEVNANLDSLKDMLLRLELRRQAGTISDDEYARERGRTEQLLRELVQG